MSFIPNLKGFFPSLLKCFVGILIFSFSLSTSPLVRAEYYPCGIEEVYWVKTPVYHTCKTVHKKHPVKHVKKARVKHVKKYYYHAPVCSRVTCDCCNDCCDYYNPDLTTGDDDPSVYPDLNIDR